MQINRKDLASGVIFVGTGLFYLIYALKTLTIGRAFNMGPGYFPVMLSSVMMIIGAVVIIRSFVVLTSTPFGIIPWRAVVMVTMSVVIFAAFLDQLGLFPAVLISALLACFSSSQIRLTQGVVVSICIAVFCWLIFKAGVRLPVRTFGSWFDGTPVEAVEPWLLSSISLIVTSLANLIRLIGLGGK